MPTSLVHNCSDELRKFAPGLSVYLHTGANRYRGNCFLQEFSRFQIILTSYGMVRQDIDFLQQCRFLYVVLDESQNIKNPSSQPFYSVKLLRSYHKLTLTGTPIENSLSDLWAQMEFLNPGILGTLDEFQGRIRGNDLINDEEETHALLNIVSPFILRRTKERVADGIAAADGRDHLLRDEH